MMPAEPAPGPVPPGEARRLARSAARLAGVQALYQMEMTAADARAVAAEFVDHRLSEAIDGLDLSAADGAFFRAIVEGAVDRQVEIDNLIDRALAEGWTLARLDSILRALLRSAAFELVARPDVPARVVINEYVEIARAFFAGDEPRFVNGILDRMARSVRAAGELAARPDGPVEG